MKKTDIEKWIKRWNKKEGKMGGNAVIFSTTSLNICILRIEVENNKSRIRKDLRCWSSRGLFSRADIRWIIGGVYVYHSRKNSSWKLVCCGGNGSDFIRLTGIIARGWISYVRIANAGRSRVVAGHAFEKMWRHRPVPLQRVRLCSDHFGATSRCRSKFSLLSYVAR